MQSKGEWRSFYAFYLAAVLLGILPRQNDYFCSRIERVNAIISKLDDGKTVFYKDIGREFLDPSGGLPGEIMPDYLHLSAKGYDIWGKAIKGDLEKLVN